MMQPPNKMDCRQLILFLLNVLKNLEMTSKRKLTVHKRPYKDTYIEGIVLQGNWLREAGYKYGQKIIVTINKNSITLQKSKT